AARAYTVGSHVVFGAGQYDARSAAGRALLAHELAHTAQRARDVVRRKPLTPEERAEDLQSPELRDDARLQEAFDNAPDMRKYETSDGVKTLQRRLRELEYALPISFAKTGDADGIYGEETEGVVKDFQRDHGLAPTGVADRDTLRELDRVFDPVITIEKVYFVEDHRQLVDNDVDWEDTGARYADWSHAPYHVVFTPGELIAESIPLSVTGGTTMSAMAWVDIQGGVPGRSYTVRARSSDVGWTLTGTGTHRKGETRDLVHLAADAPLGKQFAKLQALQFWDTISTAATRSSGMSMSTVFVTAGAVADAEREIKSDHPFVPTRKRLEQAMQFASGSDITQADRIIWKVIREFPAYGVCDAPTRRKTSISCPDIVSVWGMTPYIETGTFQCITVARYADAVFHILGIRSAVPDAVAEPVVVWADLEHRDGIISPWPHSGISEGGVRRHPIHKDWRLGLIDGHCAVNNFEACERLTWTPPGKSQQVVQIWCGGLGDKNPREGFRTARQVLANVFTLAWYTPMSKPDPTSGFPRGIIERDEENYRGIFHCNRDLGRDER
ncbi:peptidoglycan-binding protein, partial [Tahibacter caeni]|uniref:peptidoglycan-binding protein n=1 Tax=Tahibacter caeni TaxID=1453545 RepID=UPI002147E3E3